MVGDTGLEPVTPSLSRVYPQNGEDCTEPHNSTRPNEISQEAAAQARTGLNSFSPKNGDCCGDCCAETSRDVDAVVNIIRRRWDGMSRRRQREILKLLGER